MVIKYNYCSIFEMYWLMKRREEFQLPVHWRNLPPLCIEVYPVLAQLIYPKRDTSVLDTLKLPFYLQSYNGMNSYMSGLRISV